MLLKIQNALTKKRKIVARTIYMCVTAFSLVSAFLLRFELHMPKAYIGVLERDLVPVLLIRYLANRVFRLGSTRWRFVGTRDVRRLVSSVVLGTAVIYVLSALGPEETYLPASVILIEAVLTCFFTAGVWITYRMTFEEMRRRMDGGESRRVLVVGAGEAGNLLVREMLRQPTGYLPVGFVDDDPSKWGSTMQGVEVIGATIDLAPIAKALRADELIIAIPAATPVQLRVLVDRGSETQLPFKVLPGISEVLAGDIHLSQLRDIRIEDLLGREPIELEIPEVGEDLKDRMVLITGAAGSIGSELTRQIALYEPRCVILVDQAETDLFYLELELREAHPSLKLVPIVGDISEAALVENVFSTYRPERIFHAAAYKHVPMMEINAREAVRNNVLGTLLVANAAGRHDAQRFVLVSTDKAVRPTSVMGATKRIAELLVMDVQQSFPRTSFGAVRFGNVLGSNGSVIPIFRRQLESGRPLTVTHPDVTRYFMTIPEAVQLILQTSLLPGFAGHIAMLDMGEPVRIADLATSYVRLAGHYGRPAQDIIYTGLRRGEKMHEELVAPEEETLTTDVAKVRIIKSGKNGSDVKALLARLQTAVANGDNASVFRILHEMFPGLTGHQNTNGATPIPAPRLVRRVESPIPSTVQ